MTTTHLVRRGRHEVELVGRLQDAGGGMVIFSGKANRAADALLAEWRAGEVEVRLDGTAYRLTAYLGGVVLDGERPRPPRPNLEPGFRCVLQLTPEAAWRNGEHLGRVTEGAAPAPAQVDLEEWLVDGGAPFTCAGCALPPGLARRLVGLGLGTRR